MPTKQYVFLVHGMGEHEADTWAESYADSIIKALKNYSPYKDQTDEQVKGLFEFVPINYDSVYEGYRQRWQSNAANVTDEVKAANPDVGKIFEWLAEIDDPGSDAEAFFWTHLLDPLLWFAFKEARCATIAHVNEQIVSGLRRMVDDVGRGNAHIIAHSQGTSVIHDALVSLSAYPVFDPDVYKWNMIAMVANVSRLLRNRFDIDHVSAGSLSTDVNLTVANYQPHSSVLKPGDDSICDLYLNFHHVIDPFTWPMRFKPDWNYAYTSIETQNYDELLHVHDFDHYMANPDVHLPILKKLTAEPWLGAGEVDAAKAAFAVDYPNTAPPEMRELRDVFDDDEDKDLDVKAIATFIYKAYKELT